MKMINGDCLEIMDELIEKNIKVDMILCDLPYGTTRCKWDKEIPFELLWERYKKIIKSNGAVVLTAKQPFTTRLINSNLKDFRHCLVWEKNIASGYLNAKIMPLQSHEDIVVFYKEKPTYNPQKTTGHKRKVCKAVSRQNCKVSEQYSKHTKIKDYDSTERYPRSVLYFPSDKHKCSLHPTQKPVALFEYLIKTYTNEGDVVLDSCMGSGTAGVACKNLERDFIGIELNKEYFNIAKKRIEEHKPQITMF